MDESTDPRYRNFKGIVYHDNTKFDVPFMSQVGENLWMGGCTQGLILPDFVRHVVRLCVDKYQIDHHLKSNMYVQMDDSTDQALDDVLPLAEWVNHCRATEPVFVHCQGGLNRSGLVVSKALYINKFGDDQQWYSGRKIINHLREVRSSAVLCNKHFEGEVLSWG
jgi:hypothetical protein